MQLVLRDEGGECPPSIVGHAGGGALDGCMGSVSWPRIAENMPTISSPRGANNSW